MNKIHLAKYITKAAIFFILIDLILLVLNIAFNDIPFFNLDNEGNLPTYYQSAKLLLISIGTLSYIILINRHKLKLNIQLKLFWIALFLFGIYLSIDEAFQIHEDISLVLKTIDTTLPSEYENLFTLNGYNSANWLIFYIPVLIIGLLLFLTILKSLFTKFGRKVYLLIAAAILYITVFVVEYLGMNSEILADHFNTLIAIEELCEMIGTSLILLFVLKSTKDEFFISYTSNTIPTGQWSDPIT
jgi:hypothetical protein